MNYRYTQIMEGAKMLTFKYIKVKFYLAHTYTYMNAFIMQKNTSFGSKEKYILLHCLQSSKHVPYFQQNDTSK